MDAERLWNEGRRPVPTSEEVPARSEIVVAGAGLTGIAVALELAHRGRQVLVLEADGIGAGTSGGTTGKLSLLQGTRYAEIRRLAGDDALRAYAAANTAGVAWLRGELRDVPQALADRDAYTYATTDAGAAGLDRERDAARSAGLVPEVAGPDIGLPFAVRTALRAEAQGLLDPLRALSALAARAVGHGARIVTGCRVTDAAAADGGVRVSTTRGDVRADRIVLATGFPVPDRAGFFALLSADRPVRSLRPATAHGSPVLVLGGHPFVPGRQASTRAILDGMDRWVDERFGPSRRVSFWGAQDYRLPSALPFAGPVPGTDGRILAVTGFAKWGLSNAGAAALTIAETLEGRRPVWSGPLTSRRMGVRALLTVAGSNAAVAGRLARDWLRPGSRPPAPAPGQGRVVRRGWGPPVAEAMTSSGACRLSAVCTHLGGIVAWNDGEQSWDCPLHGSRFAPDGRVIEGPAARDLPPARGSVGLDRLP